jgi:outer membrane biogenesis lipoprotein LolB
MRHLIWAMVVLSGCSMLPSRSPEVDTRGPLPPSTRPVYNLAGYPAEFKDGYIDGCETAKRTQFGWKDPKRFESDKQYRQGWQDGNQICGARR